MRPKDILGSVCKQPTTGPLVSLRRRPSDNVIQSNERRDRQCVDPFAMDEALDHITRENLVVDVDLAPRDHHRRTKADDETSEECDLSPAAPTRKMTQSSGQFLTPKTIAAKSRRLSIRRIRSGIEKRRAICVKDTKSMEVSDLAARLKNGSWNETRTAVASA